MNELQLQSVAEEIKSILVEAEFGARWGLIEAHHQVGALIISLGGDRTELVHTLAVSTERGERTLWYDVKFAEAYPKLEALPEGKDITWNRVVKKYLTAPKEKIICQHVPITVCKKCREVIENG